ncbi:MAG: lipoyl(octanoyl) transferase LipB [Desulfobacterales bacterium]|nr:lipoyl(octanoyl) transferase LipB [Desulfobacterales bacterium]
MICLFADLSVIPYETARQLQIQLVAARHDGRLNRDVVLFLEHPPVLTMGRRGGCKNLTVSESFLDGLGVKLLHVERGGDITYHGPNQLIAYAIIKIQNTGMGIVDFVESLEEVMLQTVADWGIKANRNPLNHGIWVGDNKLGSIGIAVRRGITFHGLALNVNPEMSHFDWINPCGLKGIKMTSMAAHTKTRPSMAEVKKGMRRHWEKIFNVSLNDISHKALINYTTAQL